MMFGDGGDGGSEAGEQGDDVVSVVGPGMEVEGDCRCQGALRVDGRVQGTIRAGKSVVVGEGGEVEGDILTQDAVVAGHVVGSIHAESRLELREGCRVDGDIRSPSVRLEEGGRVDGELEMTPEAASSMTGDGRRGRTGAPEARPNGEAAGSGPRPQS